jgi:DNA-binding NarL/FixJ family response regulator
MSVKLDQTVWKRWPLSAMEPTVVELALKHQEWFSGRTELRLKAQHSELRTLSFDNGVEAWLQLGRETPDLLVVEWLLPEMDGVEILNRLHKLGANFPVWLVAPGPWPALAPLFRNRLDLRLISPDRIADELELFLAGQTRIRTSLEPAISNEPSGRPLASACPSHRRGKFFSARLTAAALR